MLAFRVPDKLVPSPDGSFFIAWETEHGLVELELEGDGTATWHAPGQFVSLNNALEAIKQEWEDL